MGHGFLGPTNTGGVKPMVIAGRLANERQRLLGMTDEERAWRRQFLKDQELLSEEPRVVPEMRKQLYNPIRRFYQRPLDLLGEKLTPIIGEIPAGVVRGVIPKVFFTVVAVYMGAYYFKYNSNDWSTNTGWSVFIARTRSYPGEPDFPRRSDRTKPSDYADHGFKSRKIFLD